MSIDYCFMGPEDKEEEMMPVLVMHDNKNQSIKALPVQEKGATEITVKWCVSTLEEAGYAGQKVVLKSDQEASIVALKKAIAATREGETVPIESPVRESKSNGAMERAVRTWAGQLRTLKHCFETRLGKRLPAGHVLTQ